MSTADQSRPTIEQPDEFPAEPSQIVLNGPAGKLLGMTEVPDPDCAVNATAIVCHPTGEHGTMHNKVTHIIERSFRELGARTVRFDFRGAGGSEGTFDSDGLGESEDLLAVAAWVRSVRPHDELWLGGNGFGAYVVVRACEKLNPTQIVTVSPPLKRFDFDLLTLPEGSWMLIQGDDEDEVSPEDVTKWVEGLAQPPQVLIMEDTDQTFRRRLMDLRGAIKNGIKRQQRDETDS